MWSVLLGPGPSVGIRASTASQEWLSVPTPTPYTRGVRISHGDGSNTDHERPSSCDHRPLAPAASLARTDSPAAHRPAAVGPSRPRLARPGRQPLPADHRPGPSPQPDLGPSLA